MERNHLELLQELGLTPNEAKLFLALLEGPKTGQALSKTTGIARTRVYVDLETLHSRGFIERRDGKVRMFMARPPDTVLDGILSDLENSLRKSKEIISVLRDDLRSLYCAIEELDADLPQATHERITNLDVYIQKAQELFSGTKNTVDHIACHPLIPRAFGRSIFMEGAARGVNVRFIMPLDELNNELMRRDAAENQQDNFEFRFLHQPPCRMTLYDGHVAVICSPRNCQLDARRVDVYTARQPEFVAVHQAAFEQYWQQALKFDEAMAEWKRIQQEEEGSSAQSQQTRSAAAS